VPAAATGPPGPDAEALQAVEQAVRRGFRPAAAVVAGLVKPASEDGGAAAEAAEAVEAIQEIACGAVQAEAAAADPKGSGRAAGLPKPVEALALRESRYQGGAEARRALVEAGAQAVLEPAEPGAAALVLEAVPEVAVPEWQPARKAAPRWEAPRACHRR